MDILKSLATVFLTMAMAAVGISINLSELKSMGYKPFVVGLIAAVTVGVISLIYIETLYKFIYRLIRFNNIFFLKFETKRLIKAAPTPKKIANIIENNP